MQAYAGWVVLHYRAAKSSQTHAEKLLAQGLPEAQAMLLRARIASYPSLYRVAKHDAKAGTLDLEDVLLGGTVVVHDRKMACFSPRGSSLPGSSTFWTRLVLPWAWGWGPRPSSSSRNPAWK